MAALILTGNGGAQSFNFKPHKPKLSPSQMRRHALQPLSPNPLTPSWYGSTNATIADNLEQPDPVSTTPSFLGTLCLSSEPELKDYFGTLPDSQKRDHAVQIASSNFLHSATSQSLETTPSRPALTRPGSFKSSHSPLLPHSPDGPPPNTSYSDENPPHLSITELGVCFRSGNADIDWSTSAFSPKPRRPTVDQTPCSKRKSGTSSYESARLRSTRKWTRDVARCSELPLDQVMDAAQLYGSLAYIGEEPPAPAESPVTQLQLEVHAASAARHPLSNAYTPERTIPEGRPAVSTTSDWDYIIQYYLQG